MNKTFTYILLWVLFFVVTNVAGQYSELPEEDIFRSDERRYSHLEYFGFYASAMDHWNFTEELAPYTNLTWIHFGSSDSQADAIEEYTQRLKQARDAGVQATLSIDSLLFENEKGKPREDIAIEDALVELRARLEFEGLIDTVAMIYPKDEPFREFVNHRNPGFYEQHVSGEVYFEVHEVLTHVNSLIKRVFPDKPIGVILSGYSLHHDFFSIPENYDWVGFDCYKSLFKGCDDRSFVQHYAYLLEFMQPHQRLMAVPETWVSNNNLSRDDWPDVLMARLKQHYEIALNEPRFVAFIPFIWSFDADGDVPGLGLNRFPELFDDGLSNHGSTLVDYVTSIGLQIKHGETEYPNMAYAETEEHEDRPLSNVHGAVTSVTTNGLLSAWAFNNALPHKNLRVRVLVRDHSGKLIHKSKSERTFIKDPELSEATKIARQAIGLHGYRYQLPRELLLHHSGKRLTVELLTYADGLSNKAAHIFSMELPVRRTVVSPLGEEPSNDIEIMADRLPEDRHGLTQMFYRN